MSHFLTCMNRERAGLDYLWDHLRLGHTDFSVAGENLRAAEDSVPYVEYKRKIFPPFLVSSGKMIAFFSLIMALLECKCNFYETWEYLRGNSLSGIPGVRIVWASVRMSRFFSRGYWGQRAWCFLPSLSFCIRMQCNWHSVAIVLDGCCQWKHVKNLLKCYLNEISVSHLHSK